MSVLITFDLDGTLLTGNYLHHDAFAFAFKSVFSIDARIAEVPHNGLNLQSLIQRSLVVVLTPSLVAIGMTDSAIILAVLSRHGLSREEVEPKVDHIRFTSCLLGLICVITKLPLLFQEMTNYYDMHLKVCQSPTPKIIEFF